MDMTWIVILVSVLVLQSANVKCDDQASTVGSDDGSSNRRRPLTDPEHEHIGKSQEPSEGLYFDSADWSKEAEKWSFKGGDWGLVTLPDDDHLYIPEPSVPGPVLIAEGNSMKQVIVSRSLTGLENVSLHFSYFLTNNPQSSPQLQVVQLQGDSNSTVWPSGTDISNVAYGLWTDGSVQLLPFNGDSEIKFIGQRVVDTNEIGLDDIVLRGTYMENKVGDGVLREEDNVTNTPSIAPQSENDTNTNNAQVEITTASSNNNVTIESNEVSNNSSLITENPVLNGTGTSVPDVSNQNVTNAPDNVTSNEAPNNDTGTAHNTTDQTVHLTTLDTRDNTTDTSVDITTESDNNANLTISSNMSTDTPFNNETVVNNSTNIPQNVSTDHPSQINLTSSSNMTTATSFNNETVGDNSTETPHDISTDHPFQNITSHPPSFNVTTLPSENNTAPIQNITNPPLNNTAPIQNITNPPLNISTSLPYTTNNASIFVPGPGGIEVTGSPPVEDSSWGVFKILLTITALSGCILFYLYWRQRRHQDDEIALFSRGTYSDYNNPTFQDDISTDEGLTGRGNPSNYKSFN